MINRGSREKILLAKADMRELHSRMSLLIQEDEEKHGCLHLRVLIIGVVPPSSSAAEEEQEATTAAAAF